MDKRRFLAKYPVKLQFDPSLVPRRPRSLKDAISIDPAFTCFGSRVQFSILHRDGLFGRRIGRIADRGRTEHRVRTTVAQPKTQRPDGQVPSIGTMVADAERLSNRFGCSRFSVLATTGRLQN